MSLIIYNPKQGTVRYKNISLPFYCGDTLSEIDETLARLALGLIDLQKASTKINYLVNNEQESTIE